MNLLAPTLTPLPRRRWTILLPVVFVTYGLHYLDRINTALLFPHVTHDIPMSGTTAGLAQGVTFLGYMLLQLPAVWAAHRWGPRQVAAITARTPSRACALAAQSRLEPAP